MARVTVVGGPGIIGSPGQRPAQPPRGPGRGRLVTPTAAEASESRRRAGDSEQSSQVPRSSGGSESKPRRRAAKGDKLSGCSLCHCVCETRTQSLSRADSDRDRTGP